MSKQTQVRSTEEEAMKLALEALEVINSSDNDRDFLHSDECAALWFAIDALREALAEQPAHHEPCTKCKGVGYYDEGHECDDGSMAGGNYVECDKCKQPAQQEEPVAWQFFQGGKWHNGMEFNDHRKHTEAAGMPVRDLYQSPPSLSLAQRQRSVKPLTDEEIRNIWSNGDCFEEIAFARAIEAAHGIYAPTELKEKNT